MCGSVSPVADIRIIKRIPGARSMENNPTTTQSVKRLFLLLNYIVALLIVLPSTSLANDGSICLSLFCGEEPGEPTQIAFEYAGLESPSPGLSSLSINVLGIVFFDPATYENIGKISVAYDTTVYTKLADLPDGTIIPEESMLEATLILSDGFLPSPIPELHFNNLLISNLHVSGTLHLSARDGVVAIGAPAVSVVPLPGAGWLFLSAVGLIFVRKSHHPI